MPEQRRRGDAIHSTDERDVGEVNMLGAAIESNIYPTAAGHASATRGNSSSPVCPGDIQHREAFSKEVVERREFHAPSSHPARKTRAGNPGPTRTNGPWPARRTNPHFAVSLERRVGDEGDRCSPSAAQGEGPASSSEFPIQLLSHGVLYVCTVCRL